METNKEIPTDIPNFLYKIGNKLYFAFHEDTDVTEIWNKWKKDFLEYHLSKQAEVIAGKAKVVNTSRNLDLDYYEVDKQSILQASEEYINNLK